MRLGWLYRRLRRARGDGDCGALAWAAVFLRCSFAASIVVAAAATATGSGHARVAGVSTWEATLLPGLCSGSAADRCGAQARAINDRGQIVGKGDLTSESESAYHAALWQAGRVRDLGTLGGGSSLAEDISDRGQVVGWSFVRDRILRAFLWEAGRMRNLGTLPGPHPASRERESQALAVNERGQVVGTSTVWRSGEWYRHAVLWENGRIRDLGTLPGHQVSVATGINERGEIVGWSGKSDLDSRTLHTVRWQNGRIRNLGIIGVAAINDSGHIVTSTGRLWVAGRTTNLCARVGRPCSASSINNRGWIVGSQEDNSPPDRGTLWQGRHAYRFRTEKLTDINDRGEMVSTSWGGVWDPDSASVWRIRP